MSAVSQEELMTLTLAASEIEMLADDIKASSSLGGDGVQWDSRSDQRRCAGLLVLASELRYLRTRLAS